MILELKDLNAELKNCEKRWRLEKNKRMTINETY